MEAGGLKYRKKSIAVTWLISYIIILLIPLTVNIFIFLRTQNLVADEINRANSGLLQEIRRCMDSILTDVEGLTTDIVFNSRLKGLPLQKEAFDTGDYHQLLLLSNDLKIYQNSKQTITDFYLYFRKQDVVVTPTFFESSYTFYNLTQKDKFQSCLLYTSFTVFKPTALSVTR